MLNGAIADGLVISFLLAGMRSDDTPKRLYVSADGINYLLPDG